VKEELALYFSSKMLLWPESNTWYDNECLYTFGAKDVKEAGQAAVDAYMIKRKDAIPSSAQWVGGATWYVPRCDAGCALALGAAWEEQWSPASMS